MSSMWTLSSAQYEASASPASAGTNRSLGSAGSSGGGRRGRSGASGASTGVYGFGAHRAGGGAYAYGGNGNPNNNRNPSNNNGNYNNSNNNYNNSGGNGHPYGGIPDAPKRYPELEAMSTRDISELLNDRAKFDHFIQTHPHTAAVEAALAPLRNAPGNENSNNTTTTIDDVSDADEEQLRAHVASLRKVRSDWVSKNTESHLENRLVALIEEDEKLSLRIVDEWRNQLIMYPDFIQKFIDTRTRIAERKLKLDSFREKMQRAKMNAR